MAKGNYNENSYKILVDSLDETITKDIIVQHFEKFGYVESCQHIPIMKFAIVSFLDHSIVENILKSPHVILGREVNCKKYSDTMDTLNKDACQGTMFKTEKIFVGNLPTTCSQDILRKYFEQFGKISDCVMMCDKKSGIGRGFGFVTFVNSEIVDEIIKAYDEHYIDGQWVEVKRASPENALRSLSGNQNSNFSNTKDKAYTNIIKVYN